PSRPHISSLFPYTTLFRSIQVITCRIYNTAKLWYCRAKDGTTLKLLRSSTCLLQRSTYSTPTSQIHRSSIMNKDRVRRLIRTSRSEEHTSELQSRSDLVCR